MKLQTYESTSIFRKMSTIEFCKYIGIELLPYQKLLLYLLDAKYYFKKTGRFDRLDPTERSGGTDE